MATTKAAKEERHYYLRGDVERASGRSYKWFPGYSANGTGGGMLYPWKTMAECRAEAARDGVKPVFIKES